MQLNVIYLSITILFVFGQFFMFTSLIITQNAAEIHCSPEYLVNCSIGVKYPGTAKSLISGQGTAVKAFPPGVRVRVVLQRQLETKNITFGTKIEHNACDYIKKDRLLYPGFLKFGNFPRTCPLPVQTYIVNDYQVPIQDLPPILPKGKFIATFYLLVENTSFGHLNWFGEITDNQ